jgi:uncharacterized protein (TIGR03382 family)
VGEEPDCVDASSCTVDACNPETGACDHSPDDAVCDDSNDCTINGCDPTSGCTSQALADWSPCGDQETEACFAGTCEALPGNDTCAAPAELALGQEYSVGLDAFHAWLDASAACEVEGLSGPDAFYQLGIQEGWRYSIYASPDAELDVALVVWADCAEAQECLVALNEAGEGTQEAAVDLVADRTGTLVLQVIGLGGAPSGTLKLLVEARPPDEGDLGTDAGTDLDGGADLDAGTEGDGGGKAETINDEDGQAPTDSRDSFGDDTVPSGGGGGGGGGGCSTAAQGNLALLPLLLAALGLMLRRRFRASLN